MLKLECVEVPAVHTRPVLLDFSFFTFQFVFFLFIFIIGSFCLALLHLVLPSPRLRQSLANHARASSVELAMDDGWAQTGWVGGVAARYWPVLVYHSLSLYLYILSFFLPLPRLSHQPSPRIAVLLCG